VDCQEVAVSGRREYEALTQDPSWKGLEDDGKDQVKMPAEHLFTDVAKRLDTELDKLTGVDDQKKGDAQNPTGSLLSVKRHAGLVGEQQIGRWPCAQTFALSVTNSHQVLAAEYDQVIREFNEVIKRLKGGSTNWSAAEFDTTNIVA
jgi:hypothetical protein